MGWLKLVFGRQDRNAVRSEGALGAERTLVGAPCGESLPRVQEMLSGDWQSRSRSHGGSPVSPAGSEPVAGKSGAGGRAVRYRIGDRIGGRYDVLDIFGGPGKSGMGVVYKCFDRWDKRLCALKGFQDQPAWNARVAKIFRREAELWIGVGHHPHLVAARTIRKPDGRLYLVLEYIEPDDHGRNCLSQYLKTERLSLERVVEWSVQFCWGMEHACQNGIQCHRDIKPDNIMIDREGLLKITDFGLARAFDVLPGPAEHGAPAADLTGLSLIATRDGTTCGSPPWMAPEQFGGAKQADVRNDVYSFGVVLYQMLCGGRLPFMASSVPQYAALHRQAPVPPIESPLSSVVERCLAKRPEDRYTDFVSLRRDFESHAAALGIHVPQCRPLPETVERLKDWASSLCYLERYGEALRFAQQAIKLDGRHVPALINQSLCHLGLNNAAAARESARQAVALDDGNALAWTNLACACRRLEQWTEAFDAASRATRIDRELVEAWNLLGGLYQTTGKRRQDYQKAAECYRTALAIDPYCCEAWMNMATVHHWLDQPEQALECYEQVAAIDPENSEAIERRDCFRAAFGKP
jgi:eukaryotic-like serine/threonine-protein kinase